MTEPPASSPLSHLDPEGLRLFFELSSDMVGMATPEGYFTNLNPAWERTLGWTVGELTSRPFTDFLHPDDLERTIAESQKILERGATVVGFENRYRTKSGSYRTLSWSAVTTGHSSYFVVRDVTERDLLELERQSRQEMLQGVIEHNLALIYVKDLEGRYLLYNQPFADAFALDERGGAEGLAGRQVLLGRDDTWLDPELQPVWRRNDLRAQREAYVLEEWSDHPVRGRIYYDSVKFPLRGDDGAVYATCGVSLDVTASRSLAHDLARKSAELERSNADLASFASVASHDLAEPLATLSGYAELLARRHGEDLGAGGRELVDAITAGAGRMKEMISGLLAVTRIGSAAVVSADVELERVAQSVVAELGASVEAAGARVDIGSLPTVHADEAQMRHLLQNLIANALKFVEGRAPEIALTSRRAGQGWTVCVEDNGIGIAPDRAESLFQPFERGTAGDRFAGTGIGLTIAHRVVERHEGRIWAEPREQIGSRFCFWLPDA